MATTIIPDYSKRKLREGFDLQRFINNLQEDYRICQGDSDKAGEVDTACFYEGQASMAQYILANLTIDPDTETDGKSS